MFLHLGAGHSVRTKEIVGIFEYGILAEGVSGMKVVSCLEEGEDTAKSVVLTDRELFVSAISAGTLKKRAVAIS